MALVIKGSSSGQITVDVPASAGTNTLTLPASTGEIAVGNNTPFCSVTMSATVTVSNNVTTKVPLDTVVHQSGVSFDTSNNKFVVPSGAGGTYFINAHLSGGTTNVTTLRTISTLVYVNGSQYGKKGVINLNNAFGQVATVPYTTIVNLSVGDEVEMYGNVNRMTTTAQFRSGETELTIYKLIT